MGFWQRLFFGKGEQIAEVYHQEDEPLEPEICDPESDRALDLGWYWSENKEELQMAKIAEKDRATHSYVIGATGSGKTKFLEFLIRQDIANGNGVGVIDPHGDLIEDIKGFLARVCDSNGLDSEISNRVILVDPADPLYTITFNPLEPIPDVSISEQVAELIAAFRKIWSDSWGVRMEDLMRNSLIALGEVEFTLADLPFFLSNRAFREVILGKINHPVAREYFQRFDSMTDRGQVTWIEPVMNKVNAFLSDDRIRQIFSSPKSSFNFREAMDQRKIILINLNKGKLKDSADLLGSLIMAKIQIAAFSRADSSRHKRTPFYLYIDEFQNFAGDSFSVILSEARKYGLSLIMAHQTLSQISPELRSLILGNTGIQVYFRVNRQDAALLAKEVFEYSGFAVKTVSSFRPVFWSYTEEWEQYIKELQNLSPRVCYVKHKIEGGVIPLRTFDIEPIWEAAEMTETEYINYLKGVPFGRKYQIAREELISIIEQRHNLIRKEIETRSTKVTEYRRLSKPSISPVVKDKAVEPTRELPSPVKEKKLKTDIPTLEGKGGSDHKYLQSLIKRMAEEKGYRAIIEEPTPNGQGSVDVGLAREGRKIACEISMTSTDTQELGNIEKCINAGYDAIIVCSPQEKNLEKIKALATEKIKETDFKKILFFKPEELYFYLEEEAASQAVTEENVKGFKVKVHYQPVKENDKKTKREAIAKVIVSAMQRLGGRK